MNKILLLVLSFFAVKKCGTDHTKLITQSLQKELDTIVANEMIPGASLGIVLPDDQVLKITSGFSDKEAKKKMKSDDLMFSGSVGKTYVVPVVMNLIKEGKLSLDDLAKKYFEGEDWFMQIPNAADITIRMLLSHTSGIPRYVFKQELWQKVKTNPTKEWTGKERLSYVFGDAPLHEAGKDWKYSDTNFIILGMIIEKITGKKYNDILEFETLQPLGLKHTRPSRQPNIEGLITGYSKAGPQFGLPEKITTNNRYAMNPQLEWTGGGVASSASDLARWAKILYAGKVLTKDQIQQITTPSEFKTELPDGARYGFGTFVWDNDGEVSYGHSGFMFGYVAIMEYLPKYNVSIALQVNTDQLPKGESLYGYLGQFKKALIRELK